MITIVDWFFYDTSFYVIPKILWRLTYIWSLYDVWRKNILGTYLQSHLLWRWNLRNRWSGWPQTSDFSAWPPREVEPTSKNLYFGQFQTDLEVGIVSGYQNKSICDLLILWHFVLWRRNFVWTYLHFFMTYDARWPSGTYFLTFIKKSIHYSNYCNWM